MRFSPSSLSQYKQCPRRWAFRKIAKLPEKEKKGTSVGTEGHLALERYAKRESLAGISENAIRCMTPGFKLIQSEQGIDSLEEEAFEFTFEGNDYGGKIDRLIIHDDRVIVRDWKTLKDLKWALTPERLLDDEQGVIYAWAAYEAGAERVTDQWVYLCTTKPEIKIVQVEQPKERVRRRLAVINEQADEMKNLAATLAPGEFNANMDACHSYGQLCSYHMANGGPCNPFESIEGTKEMASLADRIKAKKLTPEMLGMDEPAAEKTEAPAPLQSFVKESPAAKEEILAAVEADKSIGTPVKAEDYKFVAGDSGASPIFTVEETPKAKRPYNKKSPPVQVEPLGDGSLSGLNQLIDQVKRETGCTAITLKF